MSTTSSSLTPADHDARSSSPGRARRRAPRRSRRGPGRARRGGSATRNVSGWSVSSETLTRCRPAAARSWASSGSRTPLVVIARSTPSGREQLEEPGQVGPDRRLAAGDPDPVEAPPLDADPGDPGQLLVGEQLGPGQPLHPLLGHAVGAAEVAAVGHREPQIPHPPGERVDQRHAVGGGHPPSVRPPPSGPGSGRVRQPLMTTFWVSCPIPSARAEWLLMFQPVPLGGGHRDLTTETGHTSGRR